MDEQKTQFLLAEYSSLRQEVLDALKEVPALEKTALIISGAYWAWLLSNSVDPAYFNIAIWIPGVLMILFALRARALDKKFDSFHEYILQVEKAFKLNGLGWETFLKNEDRSWFFGSTRTFWSVLIVGNFIISIIILITQLCK